jgi:molybdopterin molybdotransferase
MPGWADTVIPVEWTDAGARRVRIFRPADPGRYIRRRGEDVTEGQVVLAAGSRLGAAQLGLCAAVGHGHVVARPRPTVAVLSTGSELVEPGEPIAPGQIWDSNSYTLTAAAREAGFAARRHGMVADEPDAVLGTVEDLCARADAIVTSGGVSMGVHDVVKEVLAGLGTVRFDQVAMRPGKPQGFGVIGDGTPIFTLPGNPVSAYVSFQVFVRPALCALQGLAPEPLPQLAATLTAPVSSPDGLRHFVRVTIAERDGRREATPALAQGSHQLAALAAADGLAVVPEQVTELDAGAPVEVMPLPAGLATRAVRER